MKKVVYICLVVMLVSLTATALAAETDEGKWNVVVIIEGKSIILTSEEGKITSELLHGFFISVERLPRTYMFDECSFVILRHSSSVEGTSGSPLSKGGCQVYSHFCDDRRDILKKWYREKWYSPQK